MAAILNYLCHFINVLSVDNESYGSVISDGLHPRNLGPVLAKTYVCHNWCCRVGYLARIALILQKSPCVKCQTGTA